ncbi:unnamed protein product [Linum trigynum]|uniref:Gnk2-homologous domain-containing protein n=1 Tax=Linum trigynum TaxID=586398 RepID=A0AAV2DPN1_9ROSI
MAHSSPPAFIVVGLLLLAAPLIIYVSGATAGRLGADEGAAAAPHFCSGPPARDSNWPYYVAQVLSALETTTPNRPTLSYNCGYPAYATGNPGGSAICHTADIADCEQCLSNLKAQLELCKNYSGGGLDRIDCNMMFWEIP